MELLMTGQLSNPFICFFYRAHDIQTLLLEAEEEKKTIAQLRTQIQRLEEIIIEREMNLKKIEKEVFESLQNVFDV